MGAASTTGWDGNTAGFGFVGAQAARQTRVVSPAWGAQLRSLLGTAQGFDPRQFFTIFFLFPKGYGVGLPGVYALWAVVVIALYPFCRWVAAVKARRRDWWLSYV